MDRATQDLSLAAQGRLDDAADALDAENAQVAKAKAAGYLAQSEFWTDLFRDEPPTFLDAPLAECMAALQSSIDGDADATTRIHRALHRIERNALPMAEAALKTIYDGEGL